MGCKGSCFLTIFLRASIPIKGPRCYLYLEKNLSASKVNKQYASCGNVFKNRIFFCMLWAFKYLVSPKSSNTHIDIHFIIIMLEQPSPFPSRREEKHGIEQHKLDGKVGGEKNEAEKNHLFGKIKYLGNNPQKPFGKRNIPPCRIFILQLPRRSTAIHSPYWFYLSKNH